MMRSSEVEIRRIACDESHAIDLSGSGDECIHGSDWPPATSLLDTTFPQLSTLMSSVDRTRPS
jgi:hypothetical protein